MVPPRLEEGTGTRASIILAVRLVVILAVRLVVFISEAYFAAYFAWLSPPHKPQNHYAGLSD